MPNDVDLGPSLTKLIKGRLYGRVWPARPSPQGPSVDGRTVALRTLAKYVAALTFWRPGAALPGGGSGPAIPFKIPTEHFFIEMPDNTRNMPFPCIAIVHDTAKYDVIGLTSYVEEDSAGVWAPNTVVQWQGEYVENIQLELWCNHKAERRALLAGIETALSPTEQMSGVRFHMPDYYDQLVCFTLNDRRLIDEPDSLRNRRRATLGIEMRFNVVALVNTVPMRPTVVVEVDDGSDGNPVVLPPGSPSVPP
jgi:hypothetical protein